MIVIHEPLNLGNFFPSKVKYRRGSQLGGLFDFIDPLHIFHHDPPKVPPAPAVPAIPLDQQVADKLAPLLQSQQQQAAPSMAMDNFLTANKGLLLAGGAGLLVLMLLKPKKSNNGGGSIVYMPMPISSPPAKGK